MNWLSGKRVSTDQAVPLCVGNKKLFFLLKDPGYSVLLHPSLYTLLQTDRQFRWTQSKIASNISGKLQLFQNFRSFHFAKKIDPVFRVQPVTVYLLKGKVEKIWCRKIQVYQRQLFLRRSVRLSLSNCV